MTVDTSVSGTSVSTTNDVVIIGAGVIGLCMARELALRGRQVTVIDIAARAQSASWSAGGIISPLQPWNTHRAVDELARESQLIYPDFVKALEQESGISTELIRSGMLIIGGQHIHAAQTWAHRVDVPIQIGDETAVKTLVPQIGSVEQGVLLPEVWQIRPPRLLAALNTSVQRLGVKLRYQTAVLKLLFQGNRVDRVVTHVGEIRASDVVVAAGAYSGSIKGLRELHLGISPIKGQMIWYQEINGATQRPVLNNGQHYAITRPDGVVLVGSTMEDNGFDLSISDSALKILKNAAITLLPHLAGLDVQGQWAGLRPAREHGIPIIGKQADCSNLYFNIGHHRNGITMAPCAAKRLADVMEGQEEASIGLGTL